MSYLTQRWGVEIEGYGLARPVVQHIVQACIDDVCDLRNDNKATSLLSWAVVHDGSIDRDGEFELRTPAMSGEEDWQKLYVVCKALRKAGAKTGITCGLHVHHDARYIVKALMVKDARLSQMTVIHCIALVAHHLYARLEPMLDTIMPPSRRGGNNRFCLPHVFGEFGRRLQVTTYGELKVTPEESGVILYTNNNHYFKLSVTALGTHGSLEYRQHSGTLLAGKIVPWIKLTALVQTAIANILVRKMALPQTFTNLPALLNWLGADTALTAYFLKRQTRLAGLRDDDNIVQWAFYISGGSSSVYLAPQTLTDVQRRQLTDSLEPLVREYAQHVTDDSLHRLQLYTKNWVSRLRQEGVVFTEKTATRPLRLAYEDENDIGADDVVDCYKGGTVPEYLALTKGVEPQEE